MKDMLSHQLKGEIQSTSDKLKSNWYAAQPWIQCLWANRMFFYIKRKNLAVQKCTNSILHSKKNSKRSIKLWHKMNLYFAANCEWHNLWLAWCIVSWVVHSHFFFFSLVKVLFSFLKLRFAWFQYWFGFYD